LELLSGRDGSSGHHRMATLPDHIASARRDPMLRRKGRMFSGLSGSAATTVAVHAGCRSANPTTAQA